MRMIDLTGKRFVRLVVLARSENSNGQTKWICQCDCGNTAITSGCHLASGHTKSCGCLQRESNLIHGMCDTSTNSAWRNMRARCRDKNAPYYKNYGGRGITICERWDKFENFLEDMGECPKGLTLERLNNDFGYSPENCKWATRKEQAQNTRTVHRIEFNGERLTKSQWAEKTGISARAIRSRLDRNWPIHEVLTRPAVPKMARRAG